MVLAVMWAEDSNARTVDVIVHRWTELFSDRSMEEEYIGDGIGDRICTSSGSKHANTTTHRGIPSAVSNQRVISNLVRRSSNII